MELTDDCVDGGPVDSLLEPETPGPGLASPGQARAEVAARVAGEAVWAPSVHNTQPWWFTIGPAGLSIYADPARQLAIADPVGREMLISCGAAVFTARLALRAAGCLPVVKILPDPAEPLRIATLSWEAGPAPSGLERRMAAAVRSRRAHRGGFGPLPLAPEFIAALNERARRQGATLLVINDEGTRAALAELVQTAERVLESRSAYTRELMAWTSPPGLGRLDGIAATAYPRRPERTSPYFPAPDFGRGRGWGMPPLTSIPGRSAGLVCVLATSADEPEDWIAAGQALQSVLLAGAAWGVAAALHSQPFQAGWRHGPLEPRPGLCPQILLRLGVTVQAGTGVRRPPDIVLQS